jgi:hypothetical protein
MRAVAMEVEDYHDIVNALSDVPSVPASVSFDIHWFGTTQTIQQRDRDQRFTGSYQLDSASIAWSAQKHGFRFQSDLADTSFTVFATIAHEHNGVFFS